MSADTIIPGITYAQSAEQHHIKTHCLSFPPVLLVSIFTVSHLSLFRLKHADLAPVKLSICCACTIENAEKDINNSNMVYFSEDYLGTTLHDSGSASCFELYNASILHSFPLDLHIFP